MKRKAKSNELDAILRQDLMAFVERVFYELHPATTFLPNWHIELIVSALMDCLEGKSPRLIINVPPRSLKSMIVTVAFVAFWLGGNPSARIICASYGQDLAEKHALDCRAIMNSNWFKRVFTTRLLQSRRSLSEFATTKHGYRLTTSVGGTLTGRGADVLILDDILKPDEALNDIQRQKTNDWFSHTAFSRLDDKANGRIIIVQQRLHENDLVGHVRPLGNWREVILPISDARTYAAVCSGICG